MVVLISIISGVLIISQKNKEESIYSEDVYSYVDDIIKDNINSDNYLNADINEKYKIINKILNSLEKAELMVYSCFGLYAKNMEELLQMTNIPVQKLADILIRLQAKGLIEEFYKNHYRKI